MPSSHVAPGFASWFCVQLGIKQIQLNDIRQRNRQESHWTFGAWDLKPAKRIRSLDCINKKWKSQNLNSMELGIRKVSRHQMKVESLSDDKLFKNDGDLERSGQDIGRCTLSL